MSGNGMLTLSGSNTYSGGTIFSGGTLQAGSNTAFGSANGPMAVNGGVLDLGGNSVSVGNLSGAGGTILNNGGSAGTLAVGSGSYGGVIADGEGQLALSKVGSGMLVLNVRQRLQRRDHGQRGTLQFQGSSALPAASPINLGSAVLQIRNDGSGSGGTISLGNNITLSLATSGDVIAVGNLATSNSGNTVAFGVLSNGTTANALKSNINFTAANGYLQSYTGLNLPGSTGATTLLNPTTTTVSITGPVTNQETSNATGHYDTLDLDGTSSGNLISGVISNSATASVDYEDTRLTKSNTSVWILTASNTYVGPTAINGGTLQIGNGGNSRDAGLAAGGSRRDRQCRAGVRSQRQRPDRFYPHQRQRQLEPDRRRCGDPHRHQRHLVQRTHDDQRRRWRSPASVGRFDRRHQPRIHRAQRHTVPRFLGQHHVAQQRNRSGTWAVADGELLAPAGIRASRERTPGLRGTVARRHQRRRVRGQQAPTTCQPTGGSISGQYRRTTLFRRRRSIATCRSGFPVWVPRLEHPLGDRHHSVHRRHISGNVTLTGNASVTPS